MSHTESLDDFCQILVNALQAVQKANELPPYMSGKAREINAGFIHANLSEILENNSILESFNNVSRKTKVCSLENVRTKNDVLRMIEEYKPFLERIKSGNYKLILERFMAAHELAIELSKLVDELSINEMIKEKSVAK